MAGDEANDDGGRSTPRGGNATESNGDSGLDLAAIGLGFGLAILAVVVLVGAVGTQRLLIDVFPGPGRSVVFWHLLTMPQPIVVSLLLGLVVGVAADDLMGSGIGVAAGLLVGNAVLGVLRFLAYLVEVPVNRGGDVLQFLVLDVTLLPAFYGVVALVGIGMAWALKR